MLWLERTMTGVAITGERAVLVEAGKNGSRVIGKRCFKETLGAPDAQGCAAAISGLMRSAGIKRGGVSISLPDTAAGAAILNFSELPSKKSEAAELVKWRVCKEFYYRPSEHTVGYQVLGSEDGMKVFAVAVKKELVERIEGAISEAGLGVKRINIHSLNLANLLEGATGDYAAVAEMDGYFTAMFFKDGGLNFYRCKGINGGAERELAATMAFYGGINGQPALGRVYVFSSNEAFVDGVKKAAPQSTVLSVKPAELVRCEGELAELIDGVDSNAILSALGAAG